MAHLRNKPHDRRPTTPHSRITTETGHLTSDQRQHDQDQARRWPVITSPPHLLHHLTVRLLSLPIHHHRTWPYFHSASHHHNIYMCQLLYGTTSHPPNPMTWHAQLTSTIHSQPRQVPQTGKKSPSSFKPLAYCTAHLRYGRMRQSNTSRVRDIARATRAHISTKFALPPLKKQARVLNTMTGTVVRIYIPLGLQYCESHVYIYPTEKE